MPQDEAPEFFHHYRILCREDGSLWELGRGAMGVTYKAEDTNLRTTVALKVVNSLYLNNPIARKRFIREARAAASLRHRNVATVYHLGNDEASYFYAMEFVDGVTLESVVEQHGPQPWRTALRYTLQVARALMAAHDKHLVHRDIKPANLMLVAEAGEDELIVKVIDFGLAKSLVEVGGSVVKLSGNGFVGTPLYASPEQCEEIAPDIRSDIYSLGVVLWYALTGKPLFNGPLGRVFAQHIHAEPAWDRLPADLPPGVRVLLARMLAKDRADRPQTPTELRHEIDLCLCDESRPASPTPPTPATRPPVPSPNELATVALSAPSAKADVPAPATGTSATLAGFPVRPATAPSEAACPVEPAPRTDAPAATTAVPTIVAPPRPGLAEPSRAPRPALRHLVALVTATSILAATFLVLAKWQSATARQKAPSAALTERAAQPSPAPTSTPALAVAATAPPIPAEKLSLAATPTPAASTPPSPPSPAAGTRMAIDIAKGTPSIFLWCPPGEFLMGSLPEETPRSNSDLPAHPVRLTRGFWLARYEVTQREYRAVMGTNPSMFPAVGKRDPEDVRGLLFSEEKIRGALSPSDLADKSAFPVELVRNTDALAFCKKLNQSLQGRLPAGCTVSLPTEAQWEYACRAGSTGPVYSGLTLDEVAWNTGNSGWTTHPVGQKKPNAWGFYDMLGNVAEHCLDVYPQPVPPGISVDPRGTTGTDECVLRGGSHMWDAESTRCAARDMYRSTARFQCRGFRIALVPAGR